MDEHQPEGVVVGCEQVIDVHVARDEAVEQERVEPTGCIGDAPRTGDQSQRRDLRAIDEVTHPSVEVREGSLVDDVVRKSLRRRRRRWFEPVLDCGGERVETIHELLPAAEGRRLPAARRPQLDDPLYRGRLAAPLSRARAACSLLQHVGQLVRRQRVVAGALAGTEVNVTAGGERLGVDAPAGVDRVRVGVDPHATEIDTEARLHERAHAVGQRAPAARVVAQPVLDPSERLVVTRKSRREEGGAGRDATGRLHHALGHAIRFQLVAITDSTDHRLSLDRAQRIHGDLVKTPLSCCGRGASAAHSCEARAVARGRPRRRPRSFGGRRVRTLNLRSHQNCPPD